MTEAAPAHLLHAVMAIVSRVARGKSVTSEVSIEHDLKIRGYDADDLIDALADEFGEWIRKLPWQRFLNFNEPPRSGVELFRFILPRSWWKTAFPGRFDLERLTPRHIASVIKCSEWREP